MENTSATGGYLIPASGMTRRELEELLRNVFSGCTGIRKLLIRPKWQVEPDNVPPRKDTWISFAVTTRESPRAQVLHLETEDGEGVSRVMTHETLDVIVSVFGPDAEDTALRLKAALQVGQNREELLKRSVAFVRAGNVATMPELVSMGWRPRADMTLTFRRAPEKNFGPVYRPDEGEGTVNIYHAEDAKSVIRESR